MNSLGRELVEWWLKENHRLCCVQPSETGHGTIDWDLGKQSIRWWALKRQSTLIELLSDHVQWPSLHFCCLIKVNKLDWAFVFWGSRINCWIYLISSFLFCIQLCQTIWDPIFIVQIPAEMKELTLSHSYSKIRFTLSFIAWTCHQYDEPVLFVD
jgi:hypothetical protein